MRRLQLVGQRFGRLLVVKDAGTRHGSLWQCVCDCGEIRVVSSSHLKDGTTVSCGCHCRDVHRTHGGTGYREYNIWVSMLQRCLNPRNHAYSDYGGRGITVCERWKKFENFLTDMGRCPPGLTIERIDNDKGYELGNCKWATRSEQALNQRRKKSAKLYDFEVREILALFATGQFIHSELAEIYTVSREMIGSIVRGKRWTHVKS